MAQYAPVQDPWEIADNPPEQSFEVFGEVLVDVWFCMLVKGSGKLPYDENAVDEKGKPYRRYTAVDLLITPLAESNLQPVERRMLAEFGEWKDVTLPSLRDIGITRVQEIVKKWAKVTTVPTGEKFIGKDGAERNKTAIKFLAIYDTEEACRTAYQAEHGQNGAQPAPASTTPVQTTPPASNGNGNGSKERETALKFLGPYVKNAVAAGNGDLDAIRANLAQKIASQALLAKYFTVDSEEVMDLIALEMSK